MSNHHAFQLYAHITWHTWKRVGCIDQLAADDIASALSHASRQSRVRVLRSAALVDHVHVVVSFRPESRLSEFVRLVKSVSALRANRRVPGALRWARGFYAATIHKRDLSRVLHYVARQFERHPDLIPQKTDPGRKPGVGPKEFGALAGKLTPGASPGWDQGQALSGEPRLFLPRRARKAGKPSAPQDGQRCTMSASSPPHTAQCGSSGLERRSRTSGSS